VCTIAGMAPAIFSRFVKISAVSLSEICVGDADPSTPLTGYAAGVSKFSMCPQRRRMSVPKPAFGIGSVACLNSTRGSHHAASDFSLALMPRS